MAEEQTQTPDQAPKQRWVKPLLIASLAVNLLVAGLVVGAVFGDRHHRHGAPRPPDSGMRPFLSALPEAQRPLVRQRLRENGQTFQETRERLRGTNQSIRRAIAAKPFEVEALKDAFAEQRRIYDGLAARSHNALADIVATMSDEERAAFLDALSKFRRDAGPERDRPQRR